MAVPWLRLLDAVIGVTDLARSRKIRSLAAGGDAAAGLEPGARAGALGGIEARLAGVVVAALKEAFDRDTRRLELEREQLEAERRRAERALQLEMLRQTADREVARLRAIAGVALVAWLGSLIFVGRVIGVGPRITLGSGWLLLLIAIAASFSGQSAVARSIPYDPERIRSDSGSSGAGGMLALWLAVAGLALVALAVLL